MARRPRSLPRVIFALLLVILVGVAAVVVYEVARVGLAAQQLYSALDGLRIVSTSQGAMEAAAIHSEVRRAREALDVLVMEDRRVAPLVRPVASALMEADLLVLGEQGLTLAQDAFAKLQPQIDTLGGTDPLAKIDMESALTTIAKAGDALASLEPQFADFAQRATHVAADTRLPEAARKLLAEAAQAAEVGARLAPLAPHLDWLLGIDAPRTLLVVAQNNDELRPTGGFISAAGTVTLDKGRISVGDLVDSYKFFREDVEHPLPPKPLETYMKTYQLLLRDANWSPDGPTSAQMAAALYANDGGVPVDGVLMLDTGALEHLIAAIGAVPLPERGVTVTADNLEHQLISFWNPQLVTATVEAGTATNGGQSAVSANWWNQRKDFIPEVALAVLKQVQAGNISNRKLASALAAALDDRSLQLWVKDEGAAAALNQLGWDGALTPQLGADFLAVVDSNLGFNKVDAVISRQLGYAVDWPADEGTAGAAVGPTATVTLTYTHHSAGSDPNCDPQSRYGNTYEDLTARCYFDYVRVYAPKGSHLVDSSGLQAASLSSEVGEKELQVFAGYFVLPSGETHTVTFTYTLPTELHPDNYLLVLQRQSGTAPLPLTLRANTTVYANTLVSGRLTWPPRANN